MIRKETPVFERQLMYKLKELSSLLNFEIMTTSNDMNLIIAQGSVYFTGNINECTAFLRGWKERIDYIERIFK